MLSYLTGKRPLTIMVNVQPDFDPLYCTTDVSWILGTSTQTVIRLIRSGALPAMKFGARWKIKESDLIAFLEEREIRGLIIRDLEKNPSVGEWSSSAANDGTTNPTPNNAKLEAI